MPRVSVFRCPFTEEIFFGESEYLEHLRHRRKMNHEMWRLKRRRDAEYKLLREQLDTIENIRALEHFVRLNFKSIILANIPEPDRNNIRALNDLVLKDFELKVSYRESCSNTHCCPRNGVKNWSCHSDKPHGYPGFHGRVSWKMVEPLDRDPNNYRDYRFDEAIRKIGIHPGTGGGSGDYRGYDVTIFIDDFPAIARRVFAAKLAGESVDANLWK